MENVSSTRRAVTARDHRVGIAASDGITNQWKQFLWIDDQAC